MKVTLGDLANKLNKIIAEDPKCGKMYISDVECASRNGYVAGLKPSEKLIKLAIYAHLDDEDYGVLISMGDDRKRTWEGGII